jgi:hypothetical protein
MKLSNIQIERLRQSASRPGRLPSDTQQQVDQDIVERPVKAMGALGHETLPAKKSVSSARFPAVKPVGVTEASPEVDRRPISRPASDWERPLCRMITPVGGAPMHTLADARNFIVELPKGTRQQEIWDRAANLLIKAAESGRATEIEAATFKIECALLIQRRLQRD